MSDIVISREEREKLVYPISNSRIDTFDRCPKKFYLQRSCKINIATLPMEIGVIVHGILHNIIMRILTMLKPPIPDVTKEMYGLLMEETFKAYAYHPKFPNFSIYLRTIQNGYAFRELMQLVFEGTVDDVKSELKVAINGFGQAVPFDDKSVWARGIIDLLVLRGDTCYIIDHKTGFSKYDYINKFQLNMYALLVFAQYPHIKKFVAKIYKMNEDSLYSKDLHIDEVNNSILELKDWEQRMMDSRFEAQVDVEKCCECGVRPLCPEFKELLRFAEITDETQVPRVLETFLAHDAEASRLKAFLNSYFKSTHSQLSLKEKTYGLFPEKLSLEITDVSAAIVYLIKLGWPKDKIYHNLSVLREAKDFLKKNLSEPELRSIARYKSERNVVLNGKKETETDD